MKKNCGRLYIFLTKYVVGAKTNPQRSPEEAHQRKEM